MAGSSQWSKWPIRNAVCLTVSRSQPEPPTVAFPQHPPFPTPPSSILQICMWACRLVILFVVCIALCIWAFYFICVYLLMHGYCLLNMFGRFLCVPWDALIGVSGISKHSSERAQKKKTPLCSSRTCTQMHRTQWFMWNIKGNHIGLGFVICIVQAA